jgi:hypothetical protein
METFAKLFERFLVFVYHCFDRIVIQGYLPLLTRPEHIVHFFRDVHGCIRSPRRSGQTHLGIPGMGGRLRPQSQDSDPEGGKGREQGGVPSGPICSAWSGRIKHGVYCIFTSMEMGSTFTSKMPKFPTEDPNYRIIRRVRSRYLHYYFYIRDPVIGPLAMCVGTYLPFQTTYYLNGHNFIEIELRRQGVAFRKDDNAFLSTSDPKAYKRPLTS